MLWIAIQARDHCLLDLERGFEVLHINIFSAGGMTFELKFLTIFGDF